MIADQIVMECSYDIDHFNGLAAWRGIEIGPSTAVHYAATGEPVVTLVAGGIKDEGKDFPAWFETPEEAWAAYDYSFQGYLEDNNGAGTKLFWRQAPGLEQNDETGRYQIWSRLLVSNKPELAVRPGYGVVDPDYMATIFRPSPVVDPPSDQQEFAATYLFPLPISSDLTESSVQRAIETLTKERADPPCLLIANEADAFVAGQICERHGFMFVALPQDLLIRDGWALAGHHNVVWSPGA